ncbi:protein CIST1-like isoform X2 [Antennarius striatus]|uniref:protein CIST1-like isoform X2 n=1 Tax=Antennarius striatus TaxID=241820 RepID=UPI0035AEA9A0
MVWNHSSDNSTAFVAEQKPISVTQSTRFAVTTKYDNGSSTQKNYNSATSRNASLSSQTINKTEAKHPTPIPTNHSSDELVSRGSMGNVQLQTELPNGTTTTDTNTSSPGLSHNWTKDDWEANPGLVVVICIFCIIAALVLVIVILKCIQSPHSNFERLEDVPMGNVNEKSPIAPYSK